jgi:hypothetical protein
MNMYRTSNLVIIEELFKHKDTNENEREEEWAMGHGP